MCFMVNDSSPTNSTVSKGAKSRKMSKFKRLISLLDPKQKFYGVFPLLHPLNKCQFYYNPMLEFTYSSKCNSSHQFTDEINHKQKVDLSANIHISLPLLFNEYFIFLCQCQSLHRQTSPTSVVFIVIVLLFFPCPPFFKLLNILSTVKLLIKC